MKRTAIYNDIFTDRVKIRLFINVYLTYFVKKKKKKKIHNSDIVVNVIFFFHYFNHRKLH